MDSFYSSIEILTIASNHPFYDKIVVYPPTPDEINDILKNLNQQGSDGPHPLLQDFPLCKKGDIYAVIRRLCADTNPKNAYRESSYTSVTGGGSGGTPMLFLTDSKENRRQRMAAGTLIKDCGLVHPRDWIVSLNTSGSFYRSLDLLAECLENAGGTVFCSGHLQPYNEIANWLADYQVNVICGDASHILQLAQYICSLPAEKRQSINLTKIIYTSESLMRSQREYLASVFTDISIFSVLGSAEAGAWAVMNTALTGQRMDDAADFIFDARAMIVEVLQRSQDYENDSSGVGVSSSHCVDGSLGVIVLTSLQRLRNPLVRYVTGDLGSLHKLPLPAAGVPDDTVPYLRVLRLHGRDQRFSFEWQAGYFEFRELQSAMQKAEFGILHWQILLTSESEPPADRLEIRILRDEGRGKSLLSTQSLVEELEHLFFVLPSNAHLFKMTHVTDAQGFERSRTGNKVTKFVDHRNE